MASPLDQASEWVQLASSSVVGLGVIATFFWTAHRQTRDAARADAAAQRAENAASLTIDEMTRMADALERIAERPVSALVSRAAEAKPGWTLSRSAGDTYLLTNTGTGPAYDVELRHDPTLVTHGDLRRDRLAPGEAVEFMAARTFGTVDSTITVAFKATAGGPEEEWRYPLPAKPRTG